MSAYTYYIQTNQDGLHIRVPSEESGGYIDVVTAKVGSHQFNLVNPLKSSAMKEVRAVAKANGLKLRKPDAVGVARF